MDATTKRTTSQRFATIVALILASVAGRAEEQGTAERPSCAAVIVPMNVPMQWDIPQSPIGDAIAQFACVTDIGIGASYNVHDCSDELVGPIRGLMTPIEALSAIMGPVCGIVEVMDQTALRTYPFDEARFDFNIGIVPRLQAMTEVGSRAGLVTGYLETNPGEVRQLVGPIVGHLSIREALEIIIRGSTLRVRWLDSKNVFFEPRRGKGSCPCPKSEKLTPPPSEHVTVIRSPLPALSEFTDAPAIVIGRKRIRDIGVSSLPDLLRYLSQTAYTRPSGYRINGAQYAEMRGGERALVLINGLRTMPSASDLAISAFDLNTVPIAAVERVEVLPDSGSAAYGTDAPGGIINIVLREPTETDAELRYGTAEGGARERRLTIRGGARDPQRRASFVLDLFEVGSLLGSARERSRDQDFRRYGGEDYRSIYGAPGNIRSIDGRRLPGLNLSYAAIPRTWAADSLSVADLKDGERNKATLSSFQSIVPSRARASFIGAGDLLLSGTSLGLEALLTQQDSSYSISPPVIPGLIVGADHPDNPFGTPVVVDALLTGLPTQALEVHSELVRVVARASGSVHRWDWDASLMHSGENVSQWLTNTVDYFNLLQSLSAENTDEAIDIFGPVPGSRQVQPSFLAPRIIDRSYSRGRQFVAMAEGPLFSLPAGSASARVGAELRRESARFDSVIGMLSRDISSGFAQMHIPLLGARQHWRGVKELYLTAGARRDKYDDVGLITRLQLGVAWRMSPFVKLHGSFGQTFEPPSLFELFSPQIEMPVQVLDARRSETTVTTVALGGRNDLQPSEGETHSLGILIGPEDGWKVSADYWRMRINNRIALLPLDVALRNEFALDSRFERAPPTVADVAAGLPGRLQRIDLSRANFGALTAAGVDIGAQVEFETSLGRFSPRASVTWMDNFEFRDLPAGAAPMVDRVGVASARGTITDWRAVASLSWERGPYAATGHMRYYPGYSDSEGGEPIDSHVDGQMLFDFNASIRVIKHGTLTIGALNILNSVPDFSNAGTTWGYDTSQGDMTLRSAYLRLNYEF